MKVVVFCIDKERVFSEAGLRNYRVIGQLVLAGP